MPNVRGSRSEFERELREVNQALVVSSVHQQEITERAQRAETALRKSEAKLRVETEDMGRINRAAVGRESRIIELKQEINELTERLGESPRYPLGFGDAEVAGAVQEALATADVEERITESEGVAPLETVLCTEELTRRTLRRPDYQADSAAFVSLIAAMADSPGEVLQLLVQKVLEIVKAGTVGISVLSPDGKRFHWSAIAGMWQARTGGSTPRDFSPCGDVLERNAPLLFHHVERRYRYLQSVTPLANEALFVPLYIESQAVGALWALQHGDRWFDAEDLRQLQNLGGLASAAYRAAQGRARALSGRMAALNLMEDALQSRKAMERAYLDLSASEERYHSLFNSIDEGFCVIEMLFDSNGDPVDYRFLETNPAFEKQCGLHDAVGKCVRALVPDLEAHWFERYGRVALTGESMRFIDEAHALNDRWFDVYAFRLGAPECRRVAVLFNDITVRRRLEEKTQEQAHSLADLNRRKDQFLAMLSHELRNPLAAIRNAAHLIRLQRTKHAIQVDAQGMLDRQVSQLTRLVDDLLDVSRISTGRIRLQVESVDLRRLVGRAVEIARPPADHKGQLLRESLPKEALWVEGDPARLEQVVVNLLDNANKYTDRGGLIAVALQKEGDEAVLRIRDNGVGISPEVLPHVFDLFAQADQSLDRAKGGLGIGLALVRSLVTMHGGRVETHSALGQGSEFIIRLPIGSSSHQRSISTGETVRAPAHALRVLVVEDNPDVARSFQRLLRASGHNVRVAHHGVRAMKMAQEFMPNAVLLDIGLPVIDGLQLARWIRHEPGLRKVLLVAVTGYGLDADRQRTREAGFDHHLVKPINFAEIESILATATVDTI